MVAVLLFALLGCMEKEIGEMPPVAQPPLALRACSVEADCILIDISCAGCCEREGINRKDSAEYLDHKKSVCVGNPVGICKCCYFPARAICDSGLCKYQELGQNCVK